MEEEKPTITTASETIVTGTTVSTYFIFILFIKDSWKILSKEL